MAVRGRRRLLSAIGLPLEISAHNNLSKQVSNDKGVLLKLPEILKKNKNYTVLTSSFLEHFQIITHLNSGYLSSPPFLALSLVSDDQIFEVQSQKAARRK